LVPDKGTSGRTAELDEVTNAICEKHKRKEGKKEIWDGLPVRRVMITKNDRKFRRE